MTPFILPSEILFLDTNICIKICNAVSKNISYSDMCYKLKYLKDKNRHTTIVFTFPYLLEGGHRKKERDYETNINETLKDANCIKNFFNASVYDINIVKQMEIQRQNLGIGQSDFQFEKQIIFYESLHDIIPCGKYKGKKIDIQNKIVDKAVECDLKLYYPIVISAIAVLYQDKNGKYAESFLKLKTQKNVSKNVVNDMVNILRFSSSGYEFIIKCFPNALQTCNIEFVTEDMELDRFIKCCNIQELHYFIKGKSNCSCLMNREYFPLASDAEWESLQNIFSTI